MPRQTPGLQRAIAALALLGIVGSLAVLYYRGRFNPEKQAEAMHRRSGIVMAQLLQQAVGPSGRILLITPETAGMGLEEKQRWMNSLRATLEEALPAGLTVAGRETVAVWSVRSTGRSTGGAAFTLETYRAMLQRHPAVQGVVSLAGAPLGTPAAPHGGSYPPLVCFCFVREGVPELIRQGVVTAAVMPRDTPVPIERARDDWFDLLYEVVTAGAVAGRSAAAEAAASP